ncbi:MAG: four helix bundle protein [Candidatus Omnitrophica bacterium]|nr:four helix bundle protein [Candidatus Omnitrophota bacterium]
MTGFKDLIVWQKGIELVKNIYEITKSFPKEELYGLSSQMRRCVISIPSNIAEGVRRRHRKEYKQFIHISLGSSGELETQIIIAKELGYIDEAQKSNLSELIDHICRMLVSLSKKL